MSFFGVNSPLSFKIAAQAKTGVLSPAKAPMLPSIPSPSTDDVASLRRTVTLVKNLLDVREGHTGSILDKHLTLRDLMNEGALVVNVGGKSISGTPADSLVVPPGYVDPRPVLLMPPTLTNLVAQGAFKNVVLTWDMLNYANHAHVEVWRSATNALGTAVITGTTTANVYTDASVVVGATYYYWARAVAISGAYGAFNAVSGVSAALLTIGGTDLGPLVVSADKLSQGTYAGVNLVANPGAEDGLVCWASDALAVTGAGAVLSVDSTTKYGGSKSFKLTKAVTSDGGTAVSQAIPVIPGETYGFRIRLKGSSATSFGLLLRMNEMATKPGANYVTALVRASYTDLITASSPVPSAFALYEYAYVVPAGVYWVSVTVADGANGPVGFWFDDVSLGRQITASFLAAGSIAAGSAVIANAAITNALIANLAVDTAQIANGAITALKVSSLDASTITTGYLDVTNRISANSITAGKLSITSLSSITATLGAVTAGTFTLDTTGFIRGGQTAYATGTGFWVGYTGGAYKLSIGSGASMLMWDGTTLVVPAAVITGTLTTGQIADGAITNNFQAEAFSGVSLGTGGLATSVCAASVAAPSGSTWSGRAIATLELVRAPYTTGTVGVTIALQARVSGSWVDVRVVTQNFAPSSTSFATTSCISAPWGPSSWATATDWQILCTGPTGGPIITVTAFLDVTSYRK